MKGPKRQKQTQEQNKKEWASSVYVATFPPREGEPAGTLNNKVLKLLHTNLRSVFMNQKV